MLGRQEKSEGGDCETGVTEGGRSSMFSAQRASRWYPRTEVCGQRKTTNNIDIYSIFSSGGSGGVLLGTSQGPLSKKGLARP